jgi:molybdenum-dependent DNA-binding transcriptional regulator ModE
MDIMQSSLVEEMEGLEATGMGILTDQEKRILELYDRLEELQLEMALLKARGVLSQGRHPDIYSTSSHLS